MRENEREGHVIAKVYLLVLYDCLLQCKTPKVNTVPRKVSLVSARDSAYVVCTRERLPRKVSYFRPEKQQKALKSLSHIGLHT